MKTFLVIIVIVGILLLTLLIIALFVKKEYSVKREINIGKPSQEVFQYVKYLKNQDNFSRWATMDPQMRKNYSGTDGTVGFISAWDSDDNKVGKGEQEIKKITDGKRIDFEIRFIKPFSGVAEAYMTTESLDGKDHTLVKWGFKSKMKYPMNLMLLCMDMEKMIGNDLTTGLTNLKTVLEKK